MKLFLIALAAAPAYTQTFDVVVFGATPAGIAAAIHASRMGRSVALVEPTRYVGGLVTGGLSYTDFRTQEAVTGTFREYMNGVVAHYTKKYGADSQQVKDCFEGAHAEPHVSTLVFERMLAAEKTLRVFRGHTLDSVTLGPPVEGLARIRAARFRDPAAGSEVEFAGRVFVDASYEGDLAASAGAPYRIGRESTREHGERFAGLLFFDKGVILPGSTGEGDTRVQCYNFRIIMTSDPANRVAVPRPEGYSPAEFEPLLEHFRSGRVQKVYSEGHDGILRLQAIPNRKSDMNDIKNAPIRLSLPGENDEYPDGSPQVRARIVERHRRYNLGLLWFLQNDARVPEPVRRDANTWGLPKDEFTGNGHFPPALYIREARRIAGEYVFREQDALMAPGSIRAPLHEDSIGIGDYALNCHGEQKPGPLHPSITEGDFGYGGQPFQIPYGVMVPKRAANLLVPVALSATHVGFSALRLEPTWTGIGQAAGIAAAIACGRAGAVRSVKPAEIQKQLHEDGAATVYFSDTPPGSRHFLSAQYFGTRGFFHGLIDPAKVTFQPLKKRYGLQYSYAHAHHDAALDRPLDAVTRDHWVALLPATRREAARTLAGAPGLTRGEYLDRLYTLMEPQRRD